MKMSLSWQSRTNEVVVSAKSFQGILSIFQANGDSIFDAEKWLRCTKNGFLPKMEIRLVLIQTFQWFQTEQLRTFWIGKNKQ